MLKIAVISQDNKPLTPCRAKRARTLLTRKEARIISLHPFVIQLTKPASNNITPNLTMGIDAGSKHVGISISDEKEEYYALEVTLRQDISKKLTKRREAQRTRRSRLRYRKPRFNNRKRPKGWLAPSVQHKVDTHINLVKQLIKYYPIKQIIIEIAKFDIQKLQNPAIQSVDYQLSIQHGFENVKAYVRYRDDYKCTICNTTNTKLEVHHIIYKSNGGSDKPNNLITLCSNCHQKIHNGLLTPTFKTPKQFKDSTFMNVVRSHVVSKLQQEFVNIPIHVTYGYETTLKRYQMGFEKSHAIDALMISNNIHAVPCDFVDYSYKVRRNNRQVYKANKLKGNKLKNNQAPRYVFGFQLFDEVKYRNNSYYIFGRRVTGYFNIRSANQSVRIPSISYKKLSLRCKKSGYVHNVSKRIINSSLT